MNLNLYPQYLEWKQKDPIEESISTMLPNQYLYSIVETDKEIKKVQEILKLLSKKIK